MSPWVYAIMAIMFLIASCGVYEITKTILDYLCKKIVKRKECDLFEKIYKETMKEL